MAWRYLRLFRRRDFRPQSLPLPEEQLSSAGFDRGRDQRSNRPALHRMARGFGDFTVTTAWRTAHPYFDVVQNKLVEQRASAARTAL